VVNPVQPTLGSSCCVPIAFQIFGTSPGDSHFDGKLHITSHLDGAAVGHRIPCCSPVLILDQAVPLGIVSLYGFQTVGRDAFLYLPALESSWWCSIDVSQRDLSPQILELCAGMGGMGIGASFLGGIPRLSVDFNELACCHLNANSHGQVLKMDLMSADCAKLIHREFGGSPGTIAFGFPCQPFSSQGMQMGSNDVRFRTFWKGRHIIYMMQPQSAILECVAAAGDHIESKEGIQAPAASMDWLVLTLKLDLQAQWPCQRHRCMPKAWHSYGLHQWPASSPYQVVGDIFKCWGHWTDEEETDLQLFEFECLFKS
jgi:hypothetical protein